MTAKKSRNYLRWTREELDILCESWPKGGIETAKEALPHRSTESLRGKAEYLHLQVQGRSRYCKQPATDAIDFQLQKAYSNPYPRLKMLSKEINRTIGWIKWRAGILGLRRENGFKPWSDEEQSILESGLDAGIGLESIQRRLSRAGYQRSLTAISSRIEKKYLPFNRPWWTAKEVAAMMGVNSTTVGDWIAKGYLKSKRGVGPSCDCYPDEIEPNRLLHQITYAQLRSFMLSYPHVWNHKKMRIEILLDLLCGGKCGLGPMEKAE